MEDIIDDETRQDGLRICKEYLAGSWLKAELGDFLMERIRGGLSNILYKCSLSDQIDVAKGEQRIVLIRFYGQIIQENPETVLTDSVIFSLLAEKDLGPRLHGVFTGGRVEEYVPARVLQCSELHDPAISAVCARKMAQFHKLTMPIVKEPRWLFDTMTRYLDEALNNLSFCEADDERREKFKLLISYNLASEMESLKSLLEKVHSPVVFCHNDLQEGNILYVENRHCTGDHANGDQSWQLRPIDFEYASYNYRGFDIGNHFCEWCYDYKYSKPPYFTSRLEDYPTRDQQLAFIRAYLDEYKGKQDQHTGSNGVSHDIYELNHQDQDRAQGKLPPAHSECRNEEEEFMLMEINSFALASHFLWGLWGIVQSHISDIEFGYLDYALERLNAYYQQKAQVLREYGHILTKTESSLSKSPVINNHIH